MASTFSLLSEKHFLCSLCEDIFSSPVTTPCGHSFCKVCLRKYWSRSGSGKCPFCSKAFVSKPHLSVNRILADVTEQYRRSRLDGKAKSVSVGGLLNEPVGSFLGKSFKLVDYFDSKWTNLWFYCLNLKCVCRWRKQPLRWSTWLKKEFRKWINSNSLLNSWRWDFSALEPFCCRSGHPTDVKNVIYCLCVSLLPGLY